MSAGRAPILGVIAGEPERLESRFALQNHLSWPSATDLRPHLACLVIDGRPQPARRGLLLHVGPPLIHCRCLSPLEHHVPLVGVPRVEERLMHGGERRLFCFNI
jgi:hypothetical protein